MDGTLVEAWEGPKSLQAKKYSRDEHLGPPTPNDRGSYPTISHRKAELSN